MKLRLGLSTCPNDTFAFHAILERRIDLRGLEFEPELLDVQQLNDGLFAGRYDVSKASFHAALLLADNYGVVRAARPSASASARWWWRPSRTSGRAGARVLSRADDDRDAALPVAAPRRRQDRPHGVLGHRRRPATGDADLGVLIHEGRLTYEPRRPVLIEDLGDRSSGWRRRRSRSGGSWPGLALPDDVVERFTAVLRDSIAYGWANREEVLGTIRRYAQELGEDVIWPYVELYVNEHTVDLGDDGMRALETLERTAAPPVPWRPGRHRCACSGRLARLLPLDPRRAAEEPPLQRDQQLAFAERLDLLRLALLGRHVQVGVDGGVRRLERVAHLVALEDVVVRPHEPIVPLGQSDRPADCPQRAGFALDPDRDDLRRTVVAHTRIDRSANHWAPLPFDASRASSRRGHTV